jgi:hypothetical protein
MELRGERAEEPRTEEVSVRAEPEPQPARKPYEKPAFRTERIFETMALACGKISQTQGHCRFNRKSS